MATSAQRKLGRGIEQVRELCGEALAFRNGQAYIAETKRDRRSPQEIYYRVFALQMKAPPDDWPLRVGEAVYNLRCALEHAVSSARGKQFPIFIDPCEFQVTGRPWIKRVPLAIQALIEGAQPYNHTPGAPKVDQLWQLRDLANRDKHRTLSVMSVVVDLPFVASLVSPQITWNRPANRTRPLKHNAEVFAFTARAEPELREMDVNPDFTYAVAVQGITLDLLEPIARRVFEVVWECENRQPIPAITPAGFYPI